MEKAPQGQPRQTAQEADHFGMWKCSADHNRKQLPSDLTDPSTFQVHLVAP